MSFLLLLLLGTISAAAAAAPQSAVVIVPVADVWSEPSADPAKLTDDKRETQVLFGEKVLIHESSGPWVRIEAVEQPEFTHHKKWEGYPGWMLRKDLGKPKPLDRAIDQRFHPTQNASKCIGAPYLWGGLTPRDPPPSPTPSPPTGGEGLTYGIDCSGLVHLSYRNSGIVVPRDAHEQWMKAKPIKRAALLPGDLIFSSKAGTSKKITHVVLYAGEGQIIEAPQTGMSVREITFQEKYGKPLNDVESGDKVGERVVYFGSFLQK